MAQDNPFRAAGVIGWPVAHSRSPALHGYWLARHGIAGAYLPLPVRPERIEAALRGLAALGFAGANVTVPHKQAALALVDHADALARRIGAVNLIVVRADGSLEARNTDAAGFLASLRAGCPSWRAADGPAVVLGAGGAARAVVAALTDAGVPGDPPAQPHPRACRDAGRGAGRAGRGAGLGAAGGGAGGRGAAGQHDGAGDARASRRSTSIWRRCRARAAVSDIVYVPLETPLLAAARARGNPVVDGLGMLLHQAVPAFEAWFGVRPEVTAELRALIVATL